jgi:hypothetical protein
MGEKPTGTGQEADDEEAGASKTGGAIKQGGATVAPDAGRTASGVNTTRSNIKSNPST